ncbi:hypothetical protein D3C73_1415220 [compost metagenome]
MGFGTDTRNSLPMARSLRTKRSCLLYSSAIAALPRPLAKSVPAEALMKERLKPPSLAMPV